jgi:isoquinoline 1-oxidoreductase alpha subunit
MAKYSINVNRKTYTVDVASDMPLVWVLRDYVGLKGTKFGCGAAACGACTVHLNDKPVRSCQLPISTIPKNAKITTIEGISSDGHLHPIQEAWIELQVPQCGYCQSGQIMSAVALLSTNRNPTDANIDAALAGNICRCGTYDRIRKAIHKASDQVNTK